MLRICFFLATYLFFATCIAPAHASIDGTLSNFDVFNDTPTDVDGAELELEGIHSSDISNTFPSHFRNHSITDYDDGSSFGVRITFDDYFFNSNELLAPTVGQSTNGHFCVNLDGCEHFGFSASAQPTATRYFWLDENLNRIGDTPLLVPNPTWSFVPAKNNGDPAMVRAEIQVPEPVEVKAKNPDSIWVKVYKTELDRPVTLDELMSNGGVVPEDEAELETEWELLEGGKIKFNEQPVGDQDKSILRRYEYFRYTGPYDDEHEPTSIFLDQDLPAPPEGELGAFISANMVAANLVAPPEVLFADFNGDDQVDLVDFDILKSHFGLIDQTSDTGDATGDGKVDLEDFAILKNTFGQSIGVPEPSSLLLAIIACVLGSFMARGKRKS